MNKHDYHIIAIDDNIALLQTLKVVLGAHFERVATISDPKMIQGILAGGNVDAVLLDMNFDNSKLDGSDGLFWLKILKERENAEVNPKVWTKKLWGFILCVKNTIIQHCSNICTCLKMVILLITSIPPMG